MLRCWELEEMNSISVGDLHGFRGRARRGVQTLDGGPDLRLESEAGNDFQACFELKFIKDLDILGFGHRDDERFSLEPNRNT